MVLYPVTADECSLLLSKLKITNRGMNAMPVKLIILMRHLLAEPISVLINESFISGVFPDILKKALIAPIFKCNNPQIVSNYRPISVLPWLSKIFEKAIANRMVNYAAKFSLLSNHQFGDCDFFKFNYLTLTDSVENSFNEQHCITDLPTVLG